ncbi:MAG: YeeE/YedE family protein [Rhodospirillaceae bacterium]|nr:YeeE/YedE family protein [Rhodospirillaceae bacterium]
MTELTPIAALVGGLLIGLAAVLLMLFNGRIAGISGIAGQLLALPPPADWPWRAAFVVGLLAAPILLSASGLHTPDITIATPIPMLVAAGVLVGFGSAFGSGCTSGHGVCGIARLSKRSLLATATFMTAGFVTVFVVRHLIGG